MDRSTVSPRGHRTCMAAPALAVLFALALSTPARAADLLVSSEATNQVLRYDGQTGAFVSVFASGNGMSMPEGLAFGADGNLYVANIGSNRVLRFNGTTGAFIDELVPAASGIAEPVGIGFHAGALFVGERATPSVTRYDALSGAALGTFASGGLIKPDAFVFGPDGDLYVSDRDNDEVVRFDGQTGAALGTFAAGNGLSQPETPLFGGDGKLYVVSRGSNAILRYDGATGAFIDTFASAGLEEPFGMCRGADENLYVANVSSASVTRYDGATGALIDTFVPSGSGGLSTPTFLIFMPSSTETGGTGGTGSGGSGAGGSGAEGGATSSGGGEGGCGGGATTTTVVGGCGCDVVGSQTANALWAQVGFILLLLARRRRG